MGLGITPMEDEMAEMESLLRGEAEKLSCRYGLTSSCSVSDPFPATVNDPECAEKVRLLYPVQYSRKYAGDGEYEDVYNDTLNTITLAEYKQALADVKTKRKKLEEQYGSCEAVLSVSSTHENKRNGKTEYQIRGRILYGKASKGDMIQVAQNGSSNLMRIKWLQQPNGEAADSVGEGYYAIVTVAENTSCIHPGDTLIIV